MKCWKCNKKTELIRDEIEGIIFNAWKCKDCSETVTDMKQLHKLTEKFNEDIKQKSIFL